MGSSIQITTQKAEILINTIGEALERRADFVLVRDSGNG